MHCLSMYEITPILLADEGHVTKCSMSARPWKGTYVTESPNYYCLKKPMKPYPGWPMELQVVIALCPGIPWLELPWAEQLDERCTDAALASSAPWHTALMELKLWKWTRGDSGLTTSIHFCLPVNLPYQRHHLWVESPFPYLNVQECKWSIHTCKSLSPFAAHNDQDWLSNCGRQMCLHLHLSDVLIYTMCIHGKQLW